MGINRLLGDHQIIYLLKLLEFTESFKANKLRELLSEDFFVFADVPYEIKDFNFLKEDPNHSILFNETRNNLIKERYHKKGADGKLVHDINSNIVRANLLEKLLIPFLVKLSNFIPKGGIWMNTQRPEWNDANNALAGFGLSMVTTYYMYRYLGFLEKLVENEDNNIPCYEVLQNLLTDLSKVFSQDPQSSTNDDRKLFIFIEKAGIAGEQYRKSIYKGEFGQKIDLKISVLKTFLNNVRSYLKHSINLNFKR